MSATLQPHPPLSVLLSVALGQAQAALQASVAGHLGSCSACRQRQCELRADLTRLMLALEPSPVPALLREGILQAAGEIHRLFDVAEPLARLLQISRAKAHGILLRLDAPRHWHHTPQGWQLALPESRLRGAHILRLQPGQSLAWPARTGRAAGLKLWLVLQGEASDAAGRTLAATAPHHAPNKPIAVGGDLLVQPGADFLVLLSEAARGRRAPVCRKEEPPALPALHH